MTSRKSAPAAPTRPISIDQLRYLSIRNWWIVVLTGAVVGCLGLAYSLFQTPMYLSSATLYVTSGTEPNTQSAYQGSLASQQRVASYAELIASDVVIRNALDKSGLSMSVDSAREVLSTASNPETVLLSIAARDKDPAVAAILANSVAEAMTAYVEQLEQPNASSKPLAKVTVVSPAVAADKPVSPRTSRNTMLAILLGLVLGILIAAFRERFDTRLRSGDEVQQSVPSPVLAEIPTESSLATSPVIDFAVGSSRAAEGYRRLRTNLAFVSVDQPPRCILVTSPGPGEGKTTTSINLAAALAEDGNRVILVDADLRRPSIAGRLGLTGSVGLTNFLRGDGVISDFIQNGPVDGLDVLVAGTLPPNPAELVGSERAKEGVEDLKANYDFVVIDTPPILPVADAAILAQYTDGALMVVRAARTRAQDLSAAFDSLVAALSTPLGIVLNSVSVNDSRYVYYSYGQTGNGSNSNTMHGPRYPERLEAEFPMSGNH
ncbi:polysaccharide biosynthesis tyrosine autokinase [Gordonia alkanivorans]|uniref:polysaccharide biosynthesis tyrosine autokinase n=1 Tax=Gordonia alkanivorans TaxID=84096 RepID=UPI00244CA9E0|nr:polysaccharide biosynthesis tyrosine autokinase [Gordonia alkanivorans]MDH3017406.1 polysaccharide biosynthesis tyrosine autokinase [Gordonia alkanivorans]MDH3042734.1 polysaccharide biosynthesis tyrosine autokinase [Gordonia alkanivorans]